MWTCEITGMRMQFVLRIRTICVGDLLWLVSEVLMWIWAVGVIAAEAFVCCCMST
jgi:hypothetical protein